MENKLDAVFSLLANNGAFYQQLLDAVQLELSKAENAMKETAVTALYHPEEHARACGLCGKYEVWDELMRRISRAKEIKKGAG